MANTLLTIDEITLSALDVFENRLVALKTVSQKNKAAFGKSGGKIGDTLRIRKPAQFTVRSGQAWAGQNIEEQYDTLVINYQKGIDFSMSSTERKLDLNSMTDQILKPAIVRLANQVDADILEVATKAVSQAVGTPGTTPTALSTFLSAGKLLTNQDCPRGRGERTLMLDADTEASMVGQLQTNFNPQSVVSSQTITGEMPYQVGMDWMVDQNVYTHTVGTYAGTPRVNGASQSGSSLITDGWSSTSLVVGDIFTIADVYAVNPVTKATLGDLAQFVVTANVSDTGGAITASIAINGEGITGPGSPFQNVSALPADNALITMFGATGTVSPQNIVWNRDAVTVAIVGLEKPNGVNTASVKYDDQSGVGLRYIEWYDGDTDLWKSRFDVVYGILTQRAAWAVRIAASVLFAFWLGASSASAQTIASNTTLSAALSETATTMVVGSATGFTVGRYAWTGLEAVQITSVNGTTIGINRGQLGTRQQAHATSQIVVVGGIGHFNTTDPDTKAACTAGQGDAAYQPYINVLNGMVWVCDLSSVWRGTNTSPITWDSINLTR